MHDELIRYRESLKLEQSTAENQTENYNTTAIREE